MADGAQSPLMQLFLYNFCVDKYILQCLKTTAVVFFLCKKQKWNSLHIMALQPKWDARRPTGWTRFPKVIIMPYDKFLPRIEIAHLPLEALLKRL